MQSFALLISSFYHLLKYFHQNGAKSNFMLKLNQMWLHQSSMHIPKKLKQEIKQHLDYHSQLISFLIYFKFANCCLIISLLVMYPLPLPKYIICFTQITSAAIITCLFVYEIYLNTYYINLLTECEKILHQDSLNLQVPQEIDNIYCTNVRNLSYEEHNRYITIKKIFSIPIDINDIRRHIVYKIMSQKYNLHIPDDILTLIFDIYHSKWFDIYGDPLLFNSLQINPVYVIETLNNQISTYCNYILKDICFLPKHSDRTIKIPLSPWNGLQIKISITFNPLLSCLAMRELTRFLPSYGFQISVNGWSSVWTIQNYTCFVALHNLFIKVMEFAGENDGTAVTFQAHLLLDSESGDWIDNDIQMLWVNWERIKFDSGMLSPIYGSPHGWNSPELSPMSESPFIRYCGRLSPYCESDFDFDTDNITHSIVNDNLIIECEYHLTTCCSYNGLMFSILHNFDTQMNDVMEMKMVESAYENSSFVIECIERNDKVSKFIGFDCLAIEQKMNSDRIEMSITNGNKICEYEFEVKLPIKYIDIVDDNSSSSCSDTYVLTRINDQKCVIVFLEKMKRMYKIIQRIKVIWKICVKIRIDIKVVLIVCMLYVIYCKRKNKLIL
eukprot:316732_1